VAVLFCVIRLPLAIWLITTALSGIEHAVLGWPERDTRFALAIAMLFMTSQGLLGVVLGIDLIQLVWFAVGAGIVVFHRGIIAPRQKIGAPANRVA